MDHPAERTLTVIARELAKEGKGFPMTVPALQLDGVSTYRELQQRVLAGDILIYRRPVRTTDDTHMRLIGDASYRFASQAGLFLFFGIPIAALACGIFISWWFLLGIPFGFVGSRWSGKAHLRALLKSAMRSEIEFCYLFSLGMIGIMDREGTPITYA